MKETENLVFTSIDVDTLIERISVRVIEMMVISEKRKEFFEREELLQTRLSELNTSVRLDNCLRLGRLKLITLKDLTMCTERDLMRIRNFGPKSMTEVKNLLEGYGLSLRV